jgi:hypothetical protein
MLMAVPIDFGAASVRNWVKPLARAGFAARGLVYLIVGFFALLAAFGRSEVKGTEVALASLLSQPFGKALLGFAIVGLLGFGLWRFIQASQDADDHGSDAKGLAVRVGQAGSGAVHLAMAFVAARLALGWGLSGGDDPSGRWIAAAYEAGYGRWVTWAVAAIVLVVAGAQVWKGWKATFERFFRGCPPDIMRWLRPLGRFGFVARGVTFAVLASLIFYGELAYGGAEGSTPGLADALKAVQSYALGWLILLVIALGLVAFGVYSLAAARYRRVKIS